MEPLMYLLFVPVFAGLYVKLSRAKYDNSATVLMHSALLTLIAIGATTYYQDAAKAHREREAEAVQASQSAVADPRLPDAPATSSQK
jgi:putative effector of murein hydrolase LrgA (UPF0299 family)